MKNSNYVGVLVLMGGMLAVGVGFFNASAPPLVAQVEEATGPTTPWQPSQVVEGNASWYGPGFHGRPTSSGAIYNRYALTAAHRTLPPGTVVRVTNLRNGRSAVLLINDWGPVPADREIDVSEAAADVLGFRQQGLAPVRIEVYRAANAFPIE